MPSTDELVRAETDREEEMEIRLAIEEGGLPTEAEVDKLREELVDVLERFSGIVWRVDKIAAHDGEDVPFEVSLEQFGAVAKLATTVELEAQSLLRSNGRLRSAMSGLIVIRAEQQFQKARQA